MPAVLQVGLAFEVDRGRTWRECEAGVLAFSLLWGCTAQSGVAMFYMELSHHASRVLSDGPDVVHVLVVMVASQLSFTCVPASALCDHLHLLIVRSLARSCISFPVINSNSYGFVSGFTKGGGSLNITWGSGVGASAWYWVVWVVRRVQFSPSWGLGHMARCLAQGSGQGMACLFRILDVVEELEYPTLGLTS
ncbi:uncharacterized protein C8Q71DRAFT_725815 [Rhodofomes roseus]|uniref:Uncharacterized protein n=1 Tax=Rhodofomes roseus TaxID=34475 RepID=A0ABQ8K7M9_9APHY|nr:uncharacterized protein C8Q71DRAFT_725815 [Rhodofomes roseus]KAH9833139.1 hypothetical protein C8Q71DRAFT_725815 [Rhodofomes roseus]